MGRFFIFIYYNGINLKNLIQALINIYLLKNCKLFKGIENQDILNLIAEINYKVKSFKQNEIILSEHDKADFLGIMIEGNAEIRKVFPSGNSILVAKLNKYSTFGEATLFANIKSFPVNVIAKNDSKIIILNKNDLIKLFSINRKLLQNFLEVISNRIIMLNSRMALLAENSIRKKISSYLLTEANKAGSNIVHLTFSKSQLANFLGIPRPSLSRELKNMKEDGLINYGRQKIKIIDIEKLESVLLD